MIKSILLFLLQIPMADTFRSEGKIYVVIGVILLLLLGIFYYLLRLDKKMSRLEKELEDRK